MGGEEKRRRGEKKKRRKGEKKGGRRVFSVQFSVFSGEGATGNFPLKTEH